MKVWVDWKTLRPDSKEGWDYCRVLYAYYSSESTLMYLGKADGCSVRERWCRSGKPKFWDSYEGLTKSSEHVAAVGVLELPEDRRFSSELLSDVESLLIMRLQPACNEQCLKSRISRPGLVVECVGDWPYPQRIFRDVG